MLHNIRVSLGALVPLLVLIAPWAAQGQTDTALQFEVVSIQPSPPLAHPMRVGCRGGPGKSDPVLLVCQNLDLFTMVAIAYYLDDFQVSAPEWMQNVRYDVRAKVPERTTKEELRLMWQNLLPERFKLVAHRETREFQMYDLVVGKRGPKFREASVAPANDASRSYSELRLGKDGLQHMHYPHVTMAELATEVSRELKKPVNDKTGLSGKYQIDIYWTPDELVAASPDAGPTLIQAVRDQLGLQLESKKGPVEFLIVDHAERTPTDN